MSPRCLPLALLLSTASVALGCSSAGGGAPVAPPPPPPPAVVPAAFAAPSSAPAARPPDRIPTASGELLVTPVHHATLLLEHGGLRIVIDPWSKGPIGALPKADLILITDIHPDHLDLSALEALRKPDTVVVVPAAAASQVPGAEVMNNGERKVVRGIPIEAVPMYNLQRGPAAGKLYHDKGRGNGYLLELGGKRVYVSGDTECTDEMKALRDIDVAFVCMNLPYTMPPEEAAACVEVFQPKIVYPYHYRDSSPAIFQRQLAAQGAVEVRVRDFYTQ